MIHKPNKKEDCLKLKINHNNKKNRDIIVIILKDFMKSSDLRL